MTQRVGSNRIANGAITLIKTESGSLAPYEFANAAFIHANAAFEQANTGGGGGGGITTGKAIAMAIVFG